MGRKRKEREKEKTKNKTKQKKTYSRNNFKSNNYGVL
jgi:hypothetical protein